MQSFWQKLKTLVSDPKLRARLLFVLAILVGFRLLAALPIPGVNLASLENFLASNQFFGLLNLFSGGGLSQLSVIMLGVGAYITSSIIMQLLTVISPKLKAMYHEEGEIGRKKFYQQARLLTVPIGLIQGFGLIVLLTRQGVMTPLDFSGTMVSLIVIVAGSVLVMWLGELMTEYGIGNGISFLIFAGIVAVLPQQVSQLAFTYDPSQLVTYISLVVVALVVIAGIVYISEAERSVPVTYAKQAGGGVLYGNTSNYLPLRINQAGVMPIIFALSILLFPQMITNFLITSSNLGVANAASVVQRLLANGWFYSILYFLLVFLFTFFYTAITFDTESMATNLQKSGAFIPGIRPGKATEDHISKIMTRITFVGGLFLGLIAVLPIIVQSITGNQSLAIGGTALLIVVAVVIDLIKKLDAQVAMRSY